MKLIYKIILILTFSLNSVLAESFNTALKRAYETNPELNAERETLNISEARIKSFNKFLFTNNYFRGKQKPRRYRKVN